MSGLTDAQTEAILDAQEHLEDCKGLGSLAVADKLLEAGHPAFAGTVDEDAGDPIGPPMELAPVGRGPEGPPGTCKKGPGYGMTPADWLDRSGETAAAQEDKRMLPSVPHAVAEGTEALDMSDFAIPYLQLAQDMTTAEGSLDVEAGRWFLSSAPEDARPVRVVVILNVTKGRELMPPYEKPDLERALRDEIHSSTGVDIPAEQKVFCRSRNRVTPERQQCGVLSTECEGCKYAQWSTADGKRIKPPCGEYYEVLVVDQETGLPALYKAKSTAIKKFRNLNTLMLLATRNALPGKAIAPLAAFTVELSSAKVIKEKKKWHEPIFGRPQVIEDKNEWDNNLSLRRDILKSLDS